MPRRRTAAELIAQLRQFSPGSPGFALWLGAGASKSSGVPLASELIDEAILERYRTEHQGAAGEPRAETALKARQWPEGIKWRNDPDRESYSSVMEEAFINAGVREAFLRPRILHSATSLGYRRLAQLLEAKIFDTVFSTNFDNLVRKGCEGILRQPLKEVISLEQYPSEQPSTAEPRLIRMHGDFWHGNILNSEGELEKTPRIRFEMATRVLQQRGLLVAGYGGNDRGIMNDLFHDNLSNPGFCRNGLFWCLMPGEKPSHYVETLLTRDKYRRVALFEIAGFDQLIDAIAEQFQIPDGEPDWMRRLGFALSMHDLNRKLMDLISGTITDSAAFLNELEELFASLVRYLRRSEGALITLTSSGWEVVAAKHFLRRGQQLNLKGPAWRRILDEGRDSDPVSTGDAAGDSALQTLDPKRTIDLFAIRQAGKLRLLAVFASGEPLDPDGDEPPIARTALSLFAIAYGRLTEV